MWFLDHGADPNASVSGWPSPMNIAAMKYSLPIIKLLVEHGGRVTRGVLQSAAKTTETGRIKVLAFLLEQGALINEVEYEWDRVVFKKNWALGYGTALHQAAKRGNLEIVTFLLHQGAKQGIRDSQGKTAMACAKQKGHTDVVAILENYQTE